MIQPNELRIGNYFYSDKVQQKTPGNYHRVQASDFYIALDHPEWFEPIPLTPEILEKAGFRKDDSDDLACLGVQYILELPIKGECKNEIFFFFSAPGLKDVSFGEYTVNSYHGSNNIHYLHQLQNLYYALTGQELEINLSELELHL